MFDNLVESSTHKADIQRKGGFFLGTLAAYTLLLFIVVIGSIYLVDANVSAQNLELTTLVAPVPVREQPAPQPANQPQTQTANDQPALAERKVLIAQTNNPSVAPNEVSSVASNTPPAPNGARISNRDFDPIISTGAPNNDGAPSGLRNGTATPPPPLPDTPKPDLTPVVPPRKPPVKSGGVLNGKSLTKPQPVYPPVAKSAGVQGVVVVQILIDETGKVVSATAVSGPALLREAAVRAAYQARFTPTLLTQQPVKVSGTYSFNFTIR